MLKIKRFLEYRKCFSCGQEFLSYDVEKINKAYSIVSRMDNVKNLIGCMISAIENNWDSPVTINKKKKNSFKNEMERGYTSEEYNELEKLLVSN